MGRPALPEEERMKQRSIRLHPAMWESIREYGLGWLREHIRDGIDELDARKKLRAALKRTPPWLT